MRPIFRYLLITFFLPSIAFAGSPYSGKELFCSSHGSKLNATIYKNEAVMILRQSYTDSDFYEDKFLLRSDFPQPQPETRSLVLKNNTRSDWRTLDGAKQYSVYKVSGTHLRFSNYFVFKPLFRNYYAGIVLDVNFKNGALNSSCKSVVYKQTDRTSVKKYGKAAAVMM